MSANEDAYDDSYMFMEPSNEEEINSSSAEKLNLKKSAEKLKQVVEKGEIKSVDKFSKKSINENLSKSSKNELKKQTYESEPLIYTVTKQQKPTEKMKTKRSIMEINQENDMEKKINRKQSEIKNSNLIEEKTKEKFKEQSKTEELIKKNLELKNDLKVEKIDTTNKTEKVINGKNNSVPKDEESISFLNQCDQKNSEKYGIKFNVSKLYSDILMKSSKLFENLTNNEFDKTKYVLNDVIKAVENKPMEKLEKNENVELPDQRVIQKQKIKVKVKDLLEQIKNKFEEQSYLRQDKPSNFKVISKDHRNSLSDLTKKIKDKSSKVVTLIDSAKIFYEPKLLDQFETKQIVDSPTHIDNSEDFLSDRDSSILLPFEDDENKILMKTKMNILPEETKNSDLEKKILNQIKAEIEPISSGPEIVGNKYMKDIHTSSSQLGVDDGLSQSKKEIKSEEEKEEDWNSICIQLDIHKDPKTKEIKIEENVKVIPDDQVKKEPINVISEYKNEKKIGRKLDQKDIYSTQLINKKYYNGADEYSKNEKFSTKLEKSKSSIDRYMKSNDENKTLILSNELKLKSDRYHELEGEINFEKPNSEQEIILFKAETDSERSKNEDESLKKIALSNLVSYKKISCEGKNEENSSDEQTYEHFINTRNELFKIDYPDHDLSPPVIQPIPPPFHLKMMDKSKCLTNNGTEKSEESTYHEQKLALIENSKVNKKTKESKNENEISKDLKIKMCKKESIKINELKTQLPNDLDQPISTTQYSNDDELIILRLNNEIDKLGKLEKYLRKLKIILNNDDSNPRLKKSILKRLILIKKDVKKLFLVCDQLTYYQNIMEKLKLKFDCPIKEVQQTKLDDSRTDDASEDPSRYSIMNTNDSKKKIVLEKRGKTDEEIKSTKINQGEKIISKAALEKVSNSKLIKKIGQSFWLNRTLKAIFISSIFRVFLIFILILIFLTLYCHYQRNRSPYFRKFNCRLKRKT